MAILSTLRRRDLPLNHTVLVSGSPRETSSSGITIDKKTALTCSAVYGAARILAGAFSKLRIKVVRESDGAENTTHWSRKLLNVRANSLQTSKQWLRHGFLHTFLGGDSYSLIVRDSGRRVKWLIPLPSAAMTVYQGPAPTYELIYGFRPPEIPGEFYLRAEDVLHWPSLLSLDGISGCGLIPFAAGSIGLAISENEHAAGHMKNGATPSGVVEYPQKLDDTQYARIQKSIRDFNSGPENVGKVLILHNGVTWKQTGMSHKDMELVQERGFSVDDIGRFTGIPGFLMGRGESDSYNSNEQHNLALLQHVVDPWLDDFEALLRDKLLEFDDQDELDFEFDREAFLRADLETRSNYWVKGRQNGWLSANDIRGELGKERLDPEVGDVYWRPGNMTDAKDPPSEQKPLSGEQNQPPGEQKPTKVNEKPKKVNRKERRDLGLSALKHSFGDAMSRINNLIQRKNERKGGNPDEMQVFFKEKRSLFADMLSPHVMALQTIATGELTEADRLVCEKRAFELAGKYITRMLDEGEPLDTVQAMEQLFDEMEVFYGDDDA